MNDKIGTHDTVLAGNSAWKAPTFPCPACSKESKEHSPTDEDVPRDQRICSSRLCRYVGLASTFVSSDTDS